MLLAEKGVVTFQCKEPHKMSGFLGSWSVAFIVALASAVLLTFI